MRVLAMSALVCALVPGLSATAEAQPLKKLQRCLEFKDMTKPRLDCYDAIVSPRTKPKSGPARIVNDCRFLKDEDERLICFNRFVEIPDNPVAAKPISAAPKSAAREVVKPISIKKANVRHGRGDCRSQDGAGHRLPSGKCARGNPKGLSSIDHRESKKPAGINRRAHRTNHSKDPAERPAKKAKGK
jgi:hypothetical protein